MIRTALTTDPEATKQAAIEKLRQHGRLRISRIAERGDELSDALWRLIFPPGGYTYEEVQAANAKVDRSRKTADKFIDDGCTP